MMTEKIDKLSKLEKVNKPRRRFGIGEWYGRPLVTMNSTERTKLAGIQLLPKKDRPQLACPFRADTKRMCTKDGGFCTLRLYEFSLGSVSVAPGQLGALVTTCPFRFQEQGTIYAWIGETLLGSPKPIIANEVGFLEQESSEEIEEDSPADVGRIDSVLVNPANQSSWCAMEIQAVYFSGSSMKSEFEAIHSGEGRELLFPTKHRRPDFRSSGPKRLMPQLQIKVPTLRRWGKKMAIVVDRPFFNALGKMDEAKDVSNCDIAWFVVRYDEENETASLKKDMVFFTTLESAVEGLTGGSPVSLSEFEARIRLKLASKS